MRQYLVAVAVALGAALLAPAWAQTYPSQPIRLVVPWPPGGATDVIARLMSQPMGQRLGQAVIVENRAGAGGNIGTEQFVHSKPDGYTIIMATSSTNAANPHLYARLGFDPVKDFAPILFVASVPNILVVPASSPARSLQELLDAARANPGKLTYGSAGIGASQHLAGALFKNLAKVDIVHVPYKGSGPAAADLMAGHIDMMLDTGSLPHITGGKLRALAIASKSRLSTLPNVPTFEEAGLKGMIASAWYGLMAPAGTPRPVIERLNSDANAALQSPELRKQLVEFGAEIGGGSAEEFARFAAAEIKRYAEIVSISGAKLEQ
jgi:tripartite-type tricarboxylate transporter receptor subunit TctC